MNKSPVFESAEHILDFVSLAVERTVMFDRLFAVGFLRDASCDAPFGQSLTRPVGVIALVAEKFLGLRQGRQHQRRIFVAAHLAFAEQHDQRSPVSSSARNISEEGPHFKRRQIGWVMRVT
jgi:hypothetical protein